MALQQNRRVGAMMSLGKITRGLGKVGLAFEALGYVVTAVKALGRAVKRAPDARRDDDKVRQEQALDSARGIESQDMADPRRQP